MSRTRSEKRGQGNSHLGGGSPGSRLSPKDYGMRDVTNWSEIMTSRMRALGVEATITRILASPGDVYVYTDAASLDRLMAIDTSQLSHKRVHILLQGAWEWDEFLQEAIRLGGVPSCHHEARRLIQDP